MAKDLDDDELRRILALIADDDRELGDGQAIAELAKRGYVTVELTRWEGAHQSEIVRITKDGSAFLNA